MEYGSCRKAKEDAYIDNVILGRQGLTKLTSNFNLGKSRLICQLMHQ